MKKKQMSDAEYSELLDIELEIAKECKKCVKAIQAWRYLILWISSSPYPLQPGNGDANYYLSKQQSSEFAFSYNPDVDPDVFVLLSQNILYETLSDIGIKNITIETDGIVILINDLDTNGCYIAGLSLKIQCSSALSSKLYSLKKHIKQCQLGLIQGQYNPQLNKVQWIPKEISEQIIPIA